jgi:uncharacterized protein with von Willebrand factor type A (vWA) domain
MSDGRDPRLPDDDGLSGVGDGEVPDFVGARDHVLDELVRFVRALRRAGAEVPANATLTAARTLVELGFEREPARAGLRAALVTRQEDLATFDRLFGEFWRRLTAGMDPDGPAERPGSDAPDGGLAPLAEESAPGDQLDADADPVAEGDPDAVATATRIEGAGESGDPEDEDGLTTSTYSPRGARVPVDAEVTATTAGDLEVAVDQLTGALARLRGRRVGGEGDRRADARRALRESLGTGGTVFSVPRREYVRTDVRAVLLVDVSRSVLDVLDEGFLVAFLRAVADRWRHVRVFLFDEDVQEVTAAVRAPSVEAVLAALDRAETEWGGGTRIGHAVQSVRRRHPTAVDRDTAVFVVSDGLEMGDVDDLAAGMAWLSRQAAAVVWLNPLAAAAGYEPSASGMAAALPYVDGLFPFAGAADVAELARQLRLRGPGGTVGYEQDRRRTGGP